MPRFGQQRVTGSIRGRDEETANHGMRPGERKINTPWLAPDTLPETYRSTSAVETRRDISAPSTLRQANKPTKTSHNVNNGDILHIPATPRIQLSHHPRRRTPASERGRRPRPYQTTKDPPARRDVPLVRKAARARPLQDSSLACTTTAANTTTPHGRTAITARAKHQPVLTIIKVISRRVRPSLRKHKGEQLPKEATGGGGGRRRRRQRDVHPALTTTNDCGNSCTLPGSHAARTFDPARQPQYPNSNYAKAQ